MRPSLGLILTCEKDYQVHRTTPQNLLSREATNAKGIYVLETPGIITTVTAMHPPHG